jgi:cobalt-zinc-cadmium resistance protein CzcA
LKSIDELILKGTTDRLRPVLLTASAAALGFLPMAIFFCRAEVKTSDGSYWWTFTAILTMVVLLFLVLMEKNLKT